jgi:hypothetical protein
MLLPQQRTRKFWNRSKLVDGECAGSILIQLLESAVESLQFLLGDCNRNIMPHQDTIQASTIEVEKGKRREGRERIGGAQLDMTFIASISS